MPTQTPADVLLCPPPPAKAAKDDNSFRCRTVGELLASIACMLDDGDADTARSLIRACAEMYADLPLPERPDPRGL